MDALKIDGLPVRSHNRHGTVACVGRASQGTCSLEHHTTFVSQTYWLAPWSLGKDAANFWSPSLSKFLDTPSREYAIDYHGTELFPSYLYGNNQKELIQRIACGRMFGVRNLSHVQRRRWFLNTFKYFQESRHYHRVLRRLIVFFPFSDPGFGNWGRVPFLFFFFLNLIIFSPYTDQPVQEFLLLYRGHRTLAFSRFFLLSLFISSFAIPNNGYPWDNLSQLRTSNAIFHLPTFCSVNQWSMFYYWG